MIGRAILAFVLALFAWSPAFGEVLAVTQTSYDAVGRVECTVVRMNPAAFGATPSSACALGTEGTQGPDRITRNVHDAAGQLTAIQRAYATPLQQNYMSAAYTLNGQRDWVEDANGNRSDFAYDGFGRLSRLSFPSATLGAHAANAADFEQYGYDLNGNRVSVRLRSGETIAYSYDALDRETLKDVANSTSLDVYSAYDAFGRRLSARFGSTSGQGVVYSYDGLGRLASETSTIGVSRALTFQYDSASNRTRITHPDANFFEYTYDAMNRLDQVQLNGVASGLNLVGDYAYDALSRRASVTRGNGTASSYAYDGLSRLTSLTQNLAGTANDQTYSFAYTPASQLMVRSASNDNYNWAAPVVSRTYSRNGLNQYTAVSGTTHSYDPRGNLINDGARRFCYDLENRLTGVAPPASDPCVNPSTASLSYDPLGRLRSYTTGGTTTEFLYDGDRLVAEYNGATLLRRYIHGAGVDEPLLWYEGPSAGSGQRWLITDNQGSVIAEDGTTTTRYSYGPYGEPNTWTGSRFRYTGQVALPEIQLYYYKARMYWADGGRFLQTDPVGYQDDFNLYAYVGNDPLNIGDPSGMTGIVYYDNAGNVHIEMQVTFSGDAATPSNITQVTNDIQSTWSGQFGQYSVTTTVTQVPTLGASSNEIVITAGPTTSTSGHAVVNNNYRMELPQADLASPHQAINGTVAQQGQNTAGHETGHLLGAGDFYNLNSSDVQPWMAGNLMGTGNTVSEQNITNAIQNTDVLSANPNNPIQRGGINDVTHCPNGVGAGSSCQ